jgi:indolepyruvate ferredoxin oxidoreductase beta subunit
VPSIRLAEEMGNARAHNVVVLGALSTTIDGVPPEAWRKVIARWVPQRYVDVNMNAFEAGRKLGL